MAFAGVIPDPPRVTARRTDGGWLISGYAPFVSGWGVVQVFQVSAGDVQSGDVIAAVVDAVEQPGIAEIHRHRLVAADATSTVSLRFQDLFVPNEMIVSTVARKDFLTGQSFGSRLNATLPLGLAKRSCRLLAEYGQVDLAAELDAERLAVHKRLDAGMTDLPTMIAVRADGSHLALRAATSLVAAAGGRAVRRRSTSASGP